MPIDPAALLAEGVVALNAAKIVAKDQPVWLPAIATMLASVTNAALTVLTSAIATAAAAPNPTTSVIGGAIDAAAAKILSAASPTWPQAVALATAYGNEIVTFHLTIMRDATRTPGDREAAAARLCSLLRLI